ncbi:MAG: hypothetical protein AB1765_03485 [Candidatus Hydrogenedentota bacterium]
MGKKKRKVSKQIEESLGAAQPQPAEQPTTPQQEFLPEEEIQPEGIELSWKWHIITYLIVATVICILFFTYVKIMHNISVKNFKIACDVMKWGEELAKASDKTQYDNIIKEIEPEFLELQKSIIFLTSYISEIDQNRRKFDEKEQTPRCEAIDTRLETAHRLIEKNIQPLLTNNGIQLMWNDYIKKKDYLKEQLKNYFNTKDYTKNYLITEAIEDFVPAVEKVALLWDLENIYKVAIAKYIDAIRFERTNKEAWLAISRAYLKNQWEDQALESYMRVIWLDRKGGKYYKEAFADIDSMINRQPPYRDAMFYKAIGLCILERFIEASQSLKSYLETQGHSIWVEEAQKLKKMTDAEERKNIRKYLADDLWIHGRTSF